MKRQVNAAIVGSAAKSTMEEGGGADGTTMDLGIVQRLNAQKNDPLGAMRWVTF